MAKVILEQVGKVYPGEGGLVGKTAVSDVDFTIEDKEFLVMVGPSGCGKTTTLRMIAGLEDISTGRILIDGKVVNHVPPKDRDIAMVFQNYALYPHMSVRENMAFGLELRRYPREEISRRVDEAARILGLSEPDNLLERKPKALSGGQRQRVALGRAIVRHPKAFLFDEPLSNLDAKMRVQMRTEISKLHRSLGSTMIYVTHDQVEAMTMADRIVVMNAGRVQQIDTPMNLYARPANLFVAGFIGNPAMNFIHGTLGTSPGEVFFVEECANSESMPGKFPLGRDQARRLAGMVGRRVVAGIRPEHWLLSQDEGIEKDKTGFHAKLEVVEPMGAETYLHVSTTRHTFVARALSFLDKSAVGRKLAFQVASGQAHFFDPVNGQRLD